MPIYEYQCPNCGTFEVTQRITENPLKKCPTCKAKVERIISNTSFILKGGGWYATDYARSSNSKSETSEKSANTSKSEGSTETSKPAETKPDKPAAKAPD
jgi:putative FmdB family regulatory protein